MIDRVGGMIGAPPDSSAASHGRRGLRVSREGPRVSPSDFLLLVLLTAPHQTCEPSLGRPRPICRHVSDDLAQNRDVFGRSSIPGPPRPGTPKPGLDADDTGQCMELP